MFFLLDILGTAESIACGDRQSFSVILRVSKLGLMKKLSSITLVN